ncbi:hypothetical protein GGI35DRAFT_455830 [Trichoderma velutinum]
MDRGALQDGARSAPNYSKYGLVATASSLCASLVCVTPTSRSSYQKSLYTLLVYLVSPFTSISQDRRGGNTESWCLCGRRSWRCLLGIHTNMNPVYLQLHVPTARHATSGRLVVQPPSRTGTEMGWTNETKSASPHKPPQRHLHCYNSVPHMLLQYYTEKTNMSPTPYPRIAHTKHAS